MMTDTDLFTEHFVAWQLGKTVEELGSLPVSSFNKWAAFFKQLQKNGWRPS